MIHRVPAFPQSAALVTNLSTEKRWTKPFKTIPMSLRRITDGAARHALKPKSVLASPRENLRLILSDVTVV